ncbi:MAG: hypothetical protein HKN47_05140 [Pirellulaceae bacterium]|nr:hypothetical protein [Pirellulaceae bacterium]
MTKPHSFKRPLLFTLIGSVVLGALIGIFLVLQNRWGWLEVRVMLTTVVIAVASLCGLACDLSKILRGRNILPHLGLVATLVSAVLMLMVVWEVIDSEAAFKATMTVTIFAVATVHVCLLGIARLVGNYRWVYFVTTQLIYGLAAMLIAILLFEINSEMLWRFIAVLSIAVAAATLIIPILYRLGRTPENRAETLMPTDERNLAKIDEELEHLRKRVATLEKLRNEIVGGASDTTGDVAS